MYPAIFVPSSWTDPVFFTFHFLPWYQTLYHGCTKRVYVGNLATASSFLGPKSCTPPSHRTNTKNALKIYLSKTSIWSYIGKINSIYCKYRWAHPKTNKNTLSCQILGMSEHNVALKYFRIIIFPSFGQCN